MTTIICTTGTSVARQTAWTGDKAKYSRAIHSRIQELRLGADFLALASAETHSLFRLGIDRNHDRVVLLHSESPDGQACAEAIAGVIREELCDNVTIAMIPGLQVFDSTRFRRDGIQNLFKAVDQIASEDSSTVLNVTGGFKSVVPYLTLYGLLNRLSVIYIFEQSTQLLRLPSAPIAFDYENLNRSREALGLLKREGAIRKEDFLARVSDFPWEEQGWFETLLEEEDNLVTASPFAQLFFRDIDQSPGHVFLSPNARVVYDASAGDVRRHFAGLLAKVAEPLWRRAHAHAFRGAELEIFKIGNTSERLGAILRGDRVFVAELWQHDDYERKAGRLRVADYDLSKFSEWEPAETEAASIRLENEDAEPTYAELRNEIEELLRSVGTLRQRAESTTQHNVRLKAQVKSLQDIQRDHKARLTERDDQIKSLQLQNEELAAQLGARDARIQELVQLDWTDPPSPS